jgi:hypothetical protein
LFSSACGPDCWTTTWTVTNKYTVNKSNIVKTQLGVRVDSEIDGIDLDEIDFRILDTLYCLKNLNHRMKSLSTCIDCITIKIPKDITWSCDGTQQLLPTEAPQELCNAKGFNLDPDCPCRWRALIQSPAIIVTTPNLALFKDALLRYVTDEFNPWLKPELVRCMQ